MKTSHKICENQTYERSFCLIELALSFNLSLIILLLRCKALLRAIDNERNKNKKRGCGKTDSIRRHVEYIVCKDFDIERRTRSRFISVKKRFFLFFTIFP